MEEYEKEVYSYYLDIFPEDERKSLKLIKSSYEKNYTKIIEILYKNEMAGFMLLNRIKDKGYSILDYFAVLPQYRNNKIGTESLQILLSKEKRNRGIFVEVEKIGFGKDAEDNLLREKRKNFYERIGLKKLSFDLFLFDVIYTPYLFSNTEDDEDTVIGEIFNMYETIIGKERIRQNCRVIRSELNGRNCNKENN